MTRQFFYVGIVVACYVNCREVKPDEPRFVVSGAVGRFNDLTAEEVGVSHGLNNLCSRKLDNFEGLRFDASYFTSIL
jgi:hypothetical protein